MRGIYREAKRQGKVVDHIVPLSGGIVCGLHCEHNLQIVSVVENARKSNKWWPDMPEEQATLFSPDLRPYQCNLALGWGN